MNRRSARTKQRKPAANPIATGRRSAERLDAKKQSEPADRTAAKSEIEEALPPG